MGFAAVVIITGVALITLEEQSRTRLASRLAESARLAA
jgi:hypothetical protein